MKAMRYWHVPPKKKDMESPEVDNTKVDKAPDTTSGCFQIVLLIIGVLGGLYALTIIL